MSRKTLCNFAHDISLGSEGIGGICPAGMYCPEGTIDPVSCPPGTFSNVRGLKNSSQCQLCPYGKFCGKKNLTSPSGICDLLFNCVTLIKLLSARSSYFNVIDFLSFSVFLISF